MLKNKFFLHILSIVFYIFPYLNTNLFSSSCNKAIQKAIQKIELLSVIKTKNTLHYKNINTGVDVSVDLNKYKLVQKNNIFIVSKQASTPISKQWHSKSEMRKINIKITNRPIII